MSEAANIAATAETILAVAPAPAPVVPARVQQLSMLGILDKTMERAFAGKPITDPKTGKVIGATMTLRPGKEQAKAFDLAGKHNGQALAEAVLSERDNAFRRVKSYLTGLDDSHTLAKFQTRDLASGVESITVVVHKIKRAPKQLGDTPEMIAAKLGMPLDQVLAMIERQKNANKPTDVASTVTTAPADPAEATKAA